MPIGNGGIIGPNNVPSLTSAKGVWSIQEAMLAQRAGTWPLPTPDNVDPYFYSVTSLLHGDGTNGGQNNTFLDSSSNNFTITRNGNTTQGSFSPFSQTGWSNYFDGSGDFLQVADAAPMELGSGNWTIEMWVNTLNNTQYSALFTRDDGGVTTGSYVILLNTTSANGIVTFWSADVNSFSAAVLTSGSVNCRDGTWHHIAVVRNSNTLTMYIDGTATSTASFSGSFGNTAQPLKIGSETGYARDYTGYISNVRLVVGSAVYTSNFTPPTTPLTAISGTSLLTCQANRFLDASSNNFTITRNGDVSVQPFSPFNPTTAYSTSAVGGSGYFDGSGDSLRVSSGVTNQFTPGSAFTFEGWFYLNNSSASQVIFSVCGSTYDWNGSTGVLFQLYLVSGTLYWQSNGNGSAVSLSGTCPSLGNWHHIAVGYNGTTTRVWVDGASFVSGTPGYHVPTYSNILLGGDLSSANNYNGFMSNLRFVKGTDVYGASNTTITVPTSPVTAISNTQFLTNFTNGAIFDNAAVADYETVGNAQISTSVKKYGTGSIAFDGTGDYLLTDPPSAQLMAFGTGDFTVEMWVYFNAIGTNVYHFYDSRPASTDGAYPTLRTNASAQIEYVANSAVRITGLTLTTNTWYHVALCRTASQTKLFVNGTQTGSTYADTTNYLNAAARPLIGGSGFHVTTLSLNGYVDDVRISKGVARYLYNFTPPTAALPDIGGTVTLTADPYFEYTTLLLPGNGTNGAQNNTFLDSSTNAFSITRNGNTTQGTFSPFSQTGWGNFFDGTGDYLSVSGGVTNAGTGDFTLEFWAYYTGNYANYETAFDSRTSAGGFTNGFNVGLDITTGYWYAGFTVQDLLTTIPAAKNQWTHIAVTRSGTTMRLFVNGTVAGSITTSNNLTSTTNFICTYYNANNYYFNGYISNLRVVKGTAVYTANFTPSTTPLTAISGTSLLTCQSNRFIDNGPNAFAITRNGDVSVQAFSPFNPTAAWSAATNGGSGYFDGSGDFLTAPNNAAFGYGTGDFTIEMWIYPTVIQGASTPNLFDQRTANPQVVPTIYLNNGQLIYYVNGLNRITGATLVAGQWYHLAVCRASGSTRMFVNGVQSGSTYTDANNYVTSPITIFTQGPAAAIYQAGYCGDLRVVKGTALYTAPFTPPTAPLTAISGTSLLLNYTNAGIYDATSKNDLETVGNAQISTTQSKFGGSSMYFDGTDDRLVAPSNIDVAIGTADFTIEGWFYTASPATNRGLFQISTTAGGLEAGNTNNLAVYCSSSVLGVYYASTFKAGTTSISANTWTHFALVRFGGSTKLYVNGIADGGFGTNADTQNYTGKNVCVGGYFSTTYLWSGYIQGFRVTRGIARYTSNFAPPTTAFLTL